MTEVVRAKKREQPVEWIRNGDLRVDKDLQRELDLNWVEANKDSFDVFAFGVITVWERETGKYVVIDGQHRVELFRKQRGFDNDQLLPCTVLRGITFERAAALFLKLNNKRAITAFDAFKQRINSKEPDALAIVAILKALGLRVAQGTSGHAEIAAVKALDKSYRGFRRNKKDRHPEALTTTLSVILQAFGNGSKNFQATLIEGLAAFVLRYSKVADIDSLIKKMSKEYGKDGVYQLIGNARAAKQIHQGSPASNVTGVLVSLYNRQRRVGQLDAWWK